ncbi:MAG: hypothetical protein AB8U15_04015 [Rickettsiales endosymbiont of Dermacentor nuttalli]
MVISKFNLTITKRLYNSTVKTLKSSSLEDTQINTIWVPGGCYRNLLLLNIYL